jgi:hypothetical protein
VYKPKIGGSQFFPVQNSQVRGSWRSQELLNLTGCPFQQNRVKKTCEPGLVLPESDSIREHSRHGPPQEILGTIETEELLSWNRENIFEETPIQEGMAHFDAESGSVSIVPVGQSPIRGNPHQSVINLLPRRTREELPRPQAIPQIAEWGTKHEVRLDQRNEGSLSFPQSRAQQAIDTGRQVRSAEVAIQSPED